MKKLLAISSVLLGVLFLAGCSQQQTSQTQPTTSAPVVQRPTTDQSATTQPASPTTEISVTVPVDWKTYQDKKYGFEISFPPTWKSAKGDFGYNEQVNPDFSYVSFQPDGTRFEIMQIQIFTKEQWNKWAQKNDFNILAQSDTYVFAFGDDPNNLKNDCTGGGQFGKAEQERCKETSQIIKTFHVIGK